MALIPMFVMVCAAAFHVLAAGSAAGVAGAAAEAGAVAVLQDRDPVAAVRASMGTWPKHLTTVRVVDGRVVVRVVPRASLPGLAGRLAATAVADAGVAGRDAPIAGPGTGVRGGDGTSGARAGRHRGAARGPGQRSQRAPAP